MSNNVVEETEKIEIDYLNFMVEDKLPMESKQIRIETRKDPILSKVFAYVRDGWPNKVEETLKPYVTRSHELSIDQDILLWGYRVIIPEKFKLDMIKEVHSTHMGSSKMKALANQYFWWPNLDKDLELYAKNCDACNKVQSNPNKSELMKYDQCNEVLERIHIDFLGPIKGKMYLIIVDAYSKWPEMYCMNKIDSENTVSKLRDYCARYGLPRKIISDNGRQLVSDTFENFCKMNKIKHVTSAPYHPATNGAAENAVKSLKRGLNKAMNDPKNVKETMETIVARYLFAYRNTPHSVTGESPAKLMFNRKLRTRLDMLKENYRDKNIERQIENYPGKRRIEFVIGDLVWVKDYGDQNKETWVKAEVIECLGYRNYLCKLIREPLDGKDM